MKPIDWLKTALSQKSDMMGAWLWLIPKEMLKTAGGWNEKLSLNNDFEFSVRLLLQAREVVFAHGAKVYYRSGNSGTLSAVKSVAAYQSAFLSTKLGCSYLLAADDSDEMKRFCANRYQEWIYRIYPHYPALYKKFEYEVLLLCGSDKAMEGGKAFLFLQELFGWKTAKLVQLFFYKLGYGKSNS
jgi:GT2 family glycosyltransferase